MIRGLLLLALFVGAGVQAQSLSSGSTVQCPASFDAAGRQRIVCVCTPEAAAAGGTVWGVDAYTSDSSICRAARHAGAIGPGGGTVTVAPAPGQPAYPGSARNGVTTSPYGPWSHSFRFETAVAGGNCPPSFDAANAPSVTCTCPAEPAAGGGTVWGVDLYTSDSSICRAARHAGVIGPGGGTVTASAAPGQPAYPGSARNGVTTSPYGPWPRSFTFGAATPPGVAGAAVCPPSFDAAGRQPVTCLCSAEQAAAGGTVWGVDVYTSDSSICRAAVHAGVIGAGGGPVSVVPEPGRPSYPGAPRHGVTTSPYGPWSHSFRFESAPAPTGAIEACPVNMEGQPGPTVTCTCSAAAASSGSVWGTDTYSSDSSPCRAAVHAGRIGAGGGVITLRVAPGLPNYVGSARNGVTSSPWGAWRASFLVEAGK